MPDLAAPAPAATRATEARPPAEPSLWQVMAVDPSIPIDPAAPAQMIMSTPLDPVRTHHYALLSCLCLR